MTTIRAQCPDCGDVQLKIDELTVRVCDDHDDGAYRFRCPACRRTVSRAASARIVGLLLSAGAPREVWQWPAELAERPDGPPLTHDDLLDLHVLLQHDAWFEQVVTLVQRNTTG